MRTGTIIILVVLFVGIIGVIFYVHYKFEKPKEENTIQLVDLSIFAQEGSKLIRTNYTVYSNGFFYGSGLTNEFGATLFKVPLNTTITIINSNLDGQNYYRNRIDFYTDKNETTRIVLNLVKVANLSITSVVDDFKINTTIYSPGYFKNTVICLSWSVHVIFAEIVNMTKIDALENNTKCYQGPTLDNNEFNFLIQYNTFGKVDKIDHITVSYYDFDEVYIRRQTYKNNNI